MMNKIFQSGQASDLYKHYQARLTGSTGMTELVAVVTPHFPTVMVDADSGGSRRSVWRQVTIAAAVLAVAYLWKNGTIRDWAGKLLYRLTEVHHVSSSLRSVFRDTPLVETRLHDDNQHPDEAQARNSASATMRLMAAAMGLKVYFYQSSNADSRNRASGSRDWRWAKDSQVRPVEDVVAPNQLRCMVDVDYYVDMPSTLGKTANVTMLYTLTPESVCDNTVDMAFTFDEANNVVMQYTGGAVYKHGLWNYGTDALLVTYWPWWSPIPLRVTTYLVERRGVRAHRSIVLLIPIQSWGFLAAWIAKLLFDEQQLKRLVVVHDGFLRLQVHRKDGLFVSTGKPNSYSCATVNAVVDSQTARLSEIGATTLSVPTILSMVDSDRGVAANLVAYHRATLSAKLDTTFPVELGVRAFQSSAKYFDPDAKPSVKPFMPPLMHGTFAPTRTLANDAAAIQYRITDVKNTEFKVDERMQRIMSEFAELLVNEHEAHPVEVSDVFEKQNRPEQRRILTLAEVAWQLPRKISSFMKAECYAEPNAPRNISTINPTDKLYYSRFMYGLAEVMHRHPWYAFGCTPVEIAARVAHVVSGANMVIETDFSKFDGHVSNLLRLLEQTILLRAFAPSYHTMLLDLHRAQYDMKGYTTFGVKYNSGTSRASGSPETSLFNTLCNAFVSYFAIRTMNRGVYQAAEAWARLGIYGGDDGLTANIPARQLIFAAGLVGQELTCETLTRDERPSVKFLARYYTPDVWDGKEDSMCDLARQLAKFHTTVILTSDITPKMKLIAKCRSFNMSDGQTPVIGELCEKVMSLATRAELVVIDRKQQQIARMLPWSSRPDNNYPNDVGNWGNSVAESLGIDMQRFFLWIERVESLDELLATVPLIVEPRPARPKIPVYVDEQLIIPPIRRAAASEAPSPSSSPLPVETLVETEPTVAVPAALMTPAKQVPRERGRNETVNHTASTGSAPRGAIATQPSTKNGQPRGKAPTQVSRHAIVAGRREEQVKASVGEEGSLPQTTNLVKGKNLNDNDDDDDNEEKLNVYQGVHAFRVLRTYTDRRQPELPERTRARKQDAVAQRPDSTEEEARYVLVKRKPQMQRSREDRPSRKQRRQAALRTVTNVTATKTQAAHSATPLDARAAELDTIAGASVPEAQPVELLVVPGAL